MLLFLVASRLNFLPKQLLYCITEYSQPKNDLPLSNVHFFNKYINPQYKKTSWGFWYLNEFEKFDERNFFRFTWIGFLDLGLTVTFPPRTVTSLKRLKWNKWNIIIIIDLSKISDPKLFIYIKRTKLAMWRLCSLRVAKQRTNISRLDVLSGFYTSE